MRRATGVLSTGLLAICLAGAAHAAEETWNVRPMGPEGRVMICMMQLQGDQKDRGESMRRLQIMADASQVNLISSARASAEVTKDVKVIAGGAAITTAEGSPFLMQEITAVVDAKAFFEAVARTPVVEFEIAGEKRSISLASAGAKKGLKELQECQKKILPMSVPPQ